jgi:hypothetical protein
MMIIPCLITLLVVAIIAVVLVLGLEYVLGLLVVLPARVTTLLRVLVALLFVLYALQCLMSLHWIKLGHRDPYKVFRDSPAVKLDAGGRDRTVSAPAYVGGNTTLSTGTSPTIRILGPALSGTLIRDNKIILVPPKKPNTFKGNTFNDGTK